MYHADITDGRAILPVSDSMQTPDNPSTSVAVSTMHHWHQQRILDYLNRLLQDYISTNDKRGNASGDEDTSDVSQTVMLSDELTGAKLGSNYLDYRSSVKDSDA